MSKTKSFKNGGYVEKDAEASLGEKVVDNFTKDAEETTKVEEKLFKKGDLVWHDTFGSGTVIKLHGNKVMGDFGGSLRTVSTDKLSEVVDGVEDE